jgi:hypothetical protein
MVLHQLCWRLALLKFQISAAGLRAEAEACQGVLSGLGQQMGNVAWPEFAVHRHGDDKALI